MLVPIGYALHGEAEANYRRQPACHATAGGSLTYKNSLFELK